MVEIIHFQLLTSKTRVAPIKQQTIPRLELIAAKILATLVYTAKKALRLQAEVSDTKLWLDSATALIWIKKVGEWKPFIQHRAKKILKLTDRTSWQYCPSECNPGDVGSRVEKVAKLNESTLWKKELN